MNVKGSKLILIVLVLFLSTTLLAAGGTSTTQSIDFGEYTDVSLGKAGLVFSGSQYDGTITLTRVNKGNLPGMTKPNFTQHLLNTRLFNSEGQKISSLVGPVYVYFKVKGPETRLWNNGDLTIYYFNGATNKWVECPTSFIYKPGTSRVSCRISRMGLYGVGTK
jgi:hypothetical protein